jgi:hypothetical protein
LVEVDFGYMDAMEFRPRPALHPQSSGRDPGLNLSQYFYQTNHIGFFEDALNTIAIEISKRSFV